MRRFKRGLSVWLAVLMLFSVIPFSGAAAQDEPETAYQVGDVIEYGSYPQRQVKSEAVIAELDALEKDWHALSGGKSSMQYADVALNGSRYRAVQIGDSYCSAFQNACGFELNKTYYFVYQSIEWIVLDPVSGFVICNHNLDASTFADSSFHYETDDTSAQIGYSSNYESSYIRNWLNHDFNLTAFSDYEREKMYSATVDHSGGGYAFHSTLDMVFLPTRQMMTHAAYGFVTQETTMDVQRLATETDYAACMGLCCRMPSNLSWNDHSPYYPYLNAYMLGSPFTENSIYFVDCNGRVYAGSNVDCGSMILGVRPVITLDLSEKIERNGALTVDDLNVGDEIEFGSYPQTLVTDSTLIASLDGVEKEWRDAGKSFSAQICDFEYEGERYRGLTFGEACTTKNTKPDPNYAYRFTTVNYEANTPYYFRYEPLKWVVFEPDEHILFCTQAVDTRLFSAAEGVVYADSDVRAFLNGAFYEEAFSDDEKARITSGEIVSYNRSAELISSTDCLFLPSVADVQNNTDFFKSHSVATDYSYSQNHDLSNLYNYQWIYRFFVRDSSCSQTIWGTVPPPEDVHDISHYQPQPLYYTSYLYYQTHTDRTGYSGVYWGESLQAQGVQPMVKLHNAFNPCEHSYDSVVTREPTCSRIGLMTKTCVRCGFTYTEQIEKKPHSFRHYATPKTCLQDGVAYDYCTVCKRIFNTVFDKADGHTYADGVCTLCGEEQEWLYTETDGEITITGYLGSDTTAALPGMIAGKPVTAVGGSAFEGNESITFVKLPDSVRTVGDNAFKNCAALEEVFIGKGAESIGRYAFTGCGSLATVCITSVNVRLNQSFSGNDPRLLVIAPAFSNTEDSLRTNRLNRLTYLFANARDGQKSICFVGDVMMYQDLNYHYWKELVEQNREVCYFYFDKITFEGIYRENFDWENTANIDESEQYLSLERVFVGSRLDGSVLSFREFVEYLALQKNGSQLFFVDESANEHSITITFNALLRLVLNLISKALNRLAKAFKK